MTKEFGAGDFAFTAVVFLVIFLIAGATISEHRLNSDPNHIYVDLSLFENSDVFFADCIDNVGYVVFKNNNHYLFTNDGKAILLSYTTDSMGRSRYDLPEHGIKIVVFPGGTVKVGDLGAINTLAGYIGAMQMNMVESDTSFSIFQRSTMTYIGFIENEGYLFRQHQSGNELLFTTNQEVRKIGG